MSSYRGLLNVLPVTLTTDDIRELYKDNPPSYKTLEKFAPEYIIHNGKVHTTSYILQFTGQFDDEENQEFFTFDIRGMDDLIEYEVGQFGMDYFINEFGGVEVIQTLDTTPFSRYKRSIGHSKYIVVQLDYMTDHYTNEHDVDIYFLGELNLYDVKIKEYNEA